MAFFIGTPTTRENCVMVLEAKGLGQPLSNVLHQPIRYIQELDLDEVRLIVTTDGENIYVYKKKGNSWKADENPFSRSNIVR